MEAKSIILGMIRLAFLALWVSVAVEKLWDLSGFHSTLRRQPIPEWGAGILFWALPLVELAAAILLAWPKKLTVTETSLRYNPFVTASKSLRCRDGAKQSNQPASRLLRPTQSQHSLAMTSEDMHRLGLWLSAILMLAFTLFILLGVLGWYEKRPCGCGSVISSLSWDDHLWFNAASLLLAVIGLWLSWPRHTTAADGNPPSSLRASGMGVEDERSNLSYIHCDNKKRFPRKFAVFRRKP